MQWVRWEVRPWNHAEGDVGGVVIFTEDITERKLAQQELEALNQSLKVHVDIAVAEIRRKDDLLIQQGRLAAMGEMMGNIAHQWRQPLNLLGLIIQELPVVHKHGELNKEYLNTMVIKANAVISQMSKTIDDFRNFFRQDKEKVPFKAREMAETALALLKESLKNQQITVEVHTTGDPIIHG